MLKEKEFIQKAKLQKQKKVKIMKKAIMVKEDKEERVIQSLLKQMNDSDLIYLHKHNKLGVFCYALSLDLHFLNPIF